MLQASDNILLLIRSCLNVQLSPAALENGLRGARFKLLLWIAKPVFYIKVYEQRFQQFLLNLVKAC